MMEFYSHYIVELFICSVIDC